MDNHANSETSDVLWQDVRERLDQHAEMAVLSTESLLNLLQADDWASQVAVLHELSKRQVSLSEESIQNLLKDPDSSVRAAVIYYLGQRPEKRSVEAIVGSLEDPDWLVRESTLLALGELGTAGLSIPLEQLEKSRHDAQAYVSQAAEVAISRASSNSAKSSSLRGLLALFKGLKPVDISGETEALSEALSAEESLEPVITDLRPGGHIVRLPFISRVPRSRRWLSISAAACIVLALVAVWQVVLPILPGQSLPASAAPVVYSLVNQGPLSLPAWTNNNLECQQQASMAASAACGDPILSFVSNSKLLNWNAHLNRLNVAITLASNNSITLDPSTGAIIEGTPNSTLYVESSPGNWNWVVPGRYISTFITGAIVVNPGGVITYGAGGGYVVWDALSGKQLFKPDFRSLFAFSQDRQWVAVLTDDQTIQIISLGSTINGEKQPLLMASITSSQFSDLASLALSPDGKQLATISADGTMQIWQWQLSTSVLHTMHLLPANSPSPLLYVTVNWSPDMRRIATLATEDKINLPIDIWDLQSGTLQQSYNQHSAPATDMTWLDSGREILSASPAELALWDTVTGRTLLAVKAPDSLVSLASSMRWQVSANGRWLLVPTISGVEIVDLQARRVVRPLQTQSLPLAGVLSPDGQHLAVVNTTGLVQIWNLEQNQMELSYQLPAHFKDGGAKDNASVSPVDLAWSPDNKLLAVTYVGGNGGLVVLSATA